MNRRTEALAVVRKRIDAIQAKCDVLRLFYPLRYPVPVEVDEMYTLEEEAITHARNGDLRWVLHATKKEPALRQAA